MQLAEAGRHDIEPRLTQRFGIGKTIRDRWRLSPARHRCGGPRIRSPRAIRRTPRPL
jgi:hypothetical protein